MTPSSLSNLRCLRLSLSLQWQRDTDWDWLRALHQLTSIHLANHSKVCGGWHGVLTIYVSAIFVMYHHIAVWTLAKGAILHRLWTAIRFRGAYPYVNAGRGHRLVSSCYCSQCGSSDNVALIEHLW